MEQILYILAVIGAFALALQFFDLLFKFIPYFEKLRAATWTKLADGIKINSLKKKAISSNIENTLNQAVFELRDELPDGWINRAKIQWVGKSIPADLKDKQLILRIRPDDDQDFNYLNAIYYFFSSSIFPNTNQIIPSGIKKSASLYLSKRTIENKQPHLFHDFEKHFLKQIDASEHSVAGYYGDYNRIDAYGFFNSAFIREVDTLAESLRFSHDRENIEKEICNILNHLMKFERLNKLNIQEDEWYKNLSATSYGFILVANPGKKIIEGIDPYLKRARQRLKLGIKRLYVIGCHAEQDFFNEVLAALTDIKEYRIVETFKLFKDYRGQKNGLAALFIIDPVREALFKNQIDETEYEDETEISVVETPLEKTTDSNVILSESELLKLITNITLNSAESDGWIFLGKLGNRIKENYPLFNTHHYGCSSLRQLINKLLVFETKEEGEGTAKLIFVKLKNENKQEEKLKVDTPQLSPLHDAEELKRYLTIVTTALTDSSGWALLAKVGEKIKKDYPNFEPKDFGSSNLRHLFEYLKIFDVKKDGRGFFKIVHVKIKSASPSILRTTSNLILQPSAIDKVQALKMLEEIVSNLTKRNEWAYLGTVGKIIKKKDAQFDPQKFGSSSLRHLLEDSERFETKEEGEGTAKAIYVKLK